MATAPASRTRDHVLASVGYEGRGLDELLDALVVCDVDVVVDVRLTPISRRRGFSKRALSAALAERRIDYRHLPKLGNPKEHRDAFHHGALAQARRRYLALVTDGGIEALEALTDLVRVRRVALVCVERDDERCHRRCLVELLEWAVPDLDVRRL